MKKQLPNNGGTIGSCWDGMISLSSHLGIGVLSGDEVIELPSHAVDRSHQAPEREELERSLVEINRLVDGFSACQTLP